MGISKITRFLFWSACGVTWFFPVAQPSAQAITIDFVNVAYNASNVKETTGNTAQANLGKVTNEYRIGKYEITNTQYVAFLNAVAATDTYGLYDSASAANAVMGIERFGSSSSYTYAAKSGWENRPVNFVSWGDAARFANWMHNGQLTGLQDASTTEQGAYTLNGANNTTLLAPITRNASAKFFIPTIDEWYKAAYYNPQTDQYYLYPMNADSPNPSDNVALQTGAKVNGSAPTNVGSYTLAISPYGTFDQGGNVSELTDTIVSSTSRVVRGGTYSTSVFSASNLLTNLSAQSSSQQVSSGAGTLGFRLGAAPVPEPSTFILAALGGLAALWLIRKRQHRRLALLPVMQPRD